MFLILPSLASSNLAALGEQAARVRSAGYLHLDIEDGNFSPGITFGPDTVKLLRDYTDAELDAHLMVTDPEPYIEELRDYGVRSIAVHLESSRYPSRALNKIRQAGIRPGLALNYKTPVAEAVPYTDLAEYVLLLTNESDCAGIKFKPRSLERVKELRRLAPTGCEIWVDGGVTPENLPLLAAAGADRAVMGRAVFSAADPAARIRELAALAAAAKEESHV